MSQAVVFKVEVHISESDEETEAKAVTSLRDRDFAGWGRAKRNPTDPNVPMIGEELAAARALSDLSHRLVEAAAESIEAYEGHRISLTV